MYHTQIQLTAMSEIDLMRLYRSEPNQRQRSKIFKAILFTPRSNGRTWDDLIRYYAYRNKRRAEQNNLFMDEDDLYQEIVSAFLKMVDKWYDIDSGLLRSSYVWRVIDSYTNRLFQTSKTHKRKVSNYSKIDIYSPYDDNKAYNEVISSEDDCSTLKTLVKVDGIEKTFFYQDLLEYLKNGFKPEPIEAPALLKEELLALIKGKNAQESVLRHLSIKYDIALDFILTIKQKLADNLEREMFCDIIRFMEKEIKDDGIIARKHNCSRSTVTKTKQKLTEFAKHKLKAVGVSTRDYF